MRPKKLAKGRQKRKSTATIRAVRPVRPPAVIPVTDSQKVVVVVVPKIDETMPPGELAMSTLSSLELIPFLLSKS